MKCKHCGKEVKENWKACPWCKTPVTKEAPKCPNCGEEVDASWKICPICEYPLNVEGTGNSSNSIPSLEDLSGILPDDFALDLVADDIAEAQNAQYQGQLSLARSYCIRERFDDAQKIYDEMIEKDCNDVVAYIGLVRIASKNYTVFDGVAVEKAIRIAQQIARTENLAHYDADYANYEKASKAHFEEIAKAEAAAKKAKAEAERKAKEEARKAEEARLKAEVEANSKINKEFKKICSVENGILLKCKNSATTVVIPNSVTCIVNGAFKGRENLTSVTIPNSVTSIGNSAFSKCSSLKSITIPNSVTKIGIYTFYECCSLTSVTIPNSVKTIGAWAFYFCSSLINITIPNSVKSIGAAAFYYCKSLTSVTIPNSVKSIGESAFGSCSSLRTIYAPAGLDLSRCDVPSGCQIIRR